MSVDANKAEEFFFLLYRNETKPERERERVCVCARARGRYRASEREREREREEVGQQKLARRQTRGRE